MQEMEVWSLGREDPLEEEMATHSIILALEILWREEPGGLQSTRSQKIGQDWVYNDNRVFMFNGVCSLIPVSLL